MKRLEDMTLQELWELFPIVLAPHSNHWKEWASEEMDALKACLGRRLVHIHHIGSTAIEGIWAKPIIDLLAEVDVWSSLPKIKAQLMEGGYLCMSESNDRICFNKGYTPDGFAEKVFHLHLRCLGDNDEIYFRDYLNAHPEVAKEYEKLKLSLWKRFEHDRDGYTEAKADFVKHYTHLAQSSIDHPDRSPFFTTATRHEEGNRVQG